MTTRTSFSRTALITAFVALVAAMLVPALAQAATKPGDLRVVASNGETLAEHTQYTGTTRVHTSPKADCFGRGTGGSGDRAKLQGATALGIVADGLKSDRDLRPLGITDAFDFGLGVCTIGGFEAPSKGYWYLKVNHAASQFGGDQTRVRSGDDILWYLIRNYTQPTPLELALEAPGSAEAGTPFTVKVVEYADDGTRSPAQGAQVDGAAAPTGADGKTVVVAASRGREKLQATRGSDIPSNTETVCVDCGARVGERIYGTGKPDDISGTRGVDRIDAGGGDDRIVVRRGAEGDRIDCGGGRDKVIADRGQSIDAARNCERIVRL